MFILERLINLLCYTLLYSTKKKKKEKNKLKPNRNSIKIRCNLEYFGFSSLLREIRTSSQKFQNEHREDRHRPKQIFFENLIPNL